MKNNKMKLSSNLTFIYKYIIPYIFFCIFGVLLISVFIKILNIDLPIRILLSFFAFLFCLFMIPLVRLRFISYDEKDTFIKGFKENVTVSNTSVIKVKRFLFYFYRLFYKTNGKIEKVIFLPHIVGVFIRFLGKPRSIKAYESYIK